MDETDQRPPLIVCDAGPLIHLDELGCLDLLADFPVVLVPTEVWREVQGYRPSALGQSVVTRAIRRGQRSKEALLEVLSELLQRSSLHLKRSLLDDVIREAEQLKAGKMR